tara:strand:+ start:1118 stop:1309 length:192 start_codon:yes stop_codon:yes gene_type:complete
MDVLQMSDTYEQKNETEDDIKKMFNENIYSALEDAMSMKTDDMEPEDFKNLVLFILNFKCNLI